MKNDGKIYLDHEDLQDLVYEICKLCKKEKYEPDVIVGISRGGLVPGVMLSHYFNCNFIPFMMSYRDFPTEQEPSIIQKQIDNGAKVLVVDDIADSGKTLSELSKVINCENGEVKYATLHKKHSSNFSPEFVASHEIKDDDWIVYPYEFFGDVATLADELEHMTEYN